MKISSSQVGNTPRLDSARPSVRSEGASKAFSLKPKAETAAPAARPEVKVNTPEPTIAVALRSVAADFKAGRIPNREQAVHKMVSTMLREQFGPKMSNDQGFQKMEHSISSLISDDPMLSRRMETLLNRLV
jgi:hypothetical protein